MAKEKEETKKPEGKRKEGGKKKRLHLHEIRSTQARDGSIVHHATYKDHKDAAFTHPERGPTATSANPEEAGQHVAEQFGMNQMGGGGEEAGGQEPEPAAAGAGAPPQAGV
jgi:hypothetical protein